MIRICIDQNYYELLFIYVLEIHVQLGYAMDTQNP